MDFVGTGAGVAELYKKGSMQHRVGNAIFTHMLWRVVSRGKRRRLFKDGQWAGNEIT
jgi:hypothetical protein